MKTVPPGLATHLGQDVVSLCLLWEMVHRDGTRLLFTDHDRSITLGADLYLSDTGFSASSILQALNVGSLQGLTVTTFFGESLVFTERAVRGGKFSGSKCIITLINWQEPTSGGLVVFRGEVGEINLSDAGSCEIEITPVQFGDAMIGLDKYSYSCRARFGDSKCKVDVEALKAPFTVVTQTGFQSFTTLQLNQADDYWQLGRVKFVTGANADLTREVMFSVHSTRELKLQYAFPFDILPGDTGFVYPGCDKGYNSGCVRWNNRLNFRGEPLRIRT